MRQVVDEYDDGIVLRYGGTGCLFMIGLPFLLAGVLVAVSPL